MNETNLHPHPQTNTAAEFGDFRALDTYQPGYSMLFLRQLNTHPNIQRAEIKGTLPKIQHRATAGGNFPNNEQFSEIQRNNVESKALEGFFIPQIWNDLLEWKKQSGYHLGSMKAGTLTPMSPEMMDREFRSRGLNSVEKSIETEYLVQTTEHAIADAWARKMEARINNSVYKNDYNVKAFIRLKQVLFKRQQIDFPDTTRGHTWHVVPVGVQMKGVLDQGRQIVWTLFRTADKICHSAYSLPEAAMQVKVGQALTSGRGLAVALARCQPMVAKIVIQHLNNGRLEFGNNQGYNPLNFRLLEKDHKTYLELNPAIFPQIARDISEIAELENPSIMTGCPAVIATDASNRSIVSSYYDKNVELFQRHCLG